MAKTGMGIDIGGSHITCQLFDLEQHAALPGSRKRFSIDSRASSDSILNGWVEALNQTAESIGIANLEGIGFAMPGPFDYLNGIAWFKGIPKFEALYGVHVKTELIKRMHLPDNFKIRFLNDASSFAVGESWLGEVAHFDRVIALTLGTGFGTTFINNGLPVAGTDGIPEDGFLYHIPFKNSIADDYFSTRWFINNYKEKTGKQIPGVKELTLFASSDSTVQELFHEFGTNLGAFLAPWVKQFDAEAIVIGGNISKSFTWFQDDLQSQLSHTTIRISKMEESAALAGSARLCDDSFYSELLKTNIIK
jgi:glucokinase